jgi:hypothetical protein
MAVGRGLVRAIPVLCFAALLAAACQRALPRPVANAPAKAEDFHKSDPRVIGTTGRAQLIEFFGPT